MRYARLCAVCATSPVPSPRASGTSFDTRKRISTWPPATSARIERIKSRNRPSRWALAKVVGTRTINIPSWNEMASVPWNQVVKAAGWTFVCNRSIVVCQICFAFTPYYLFGDILYCLASSRVCIGRINISRTISRHISLGKSFTN